MAVKPVPEGFHTITPYLTVRGVAGLIAFLEQAFGATDVERLVGPDGSIMHAQLRIGDSRVMMGEGKGEWTPKPAALYLYLPDADAVYRRAMKAGATSIREPADQFYGDRTSAVVDLCGNTWWLATHVEDVSLAEMAKRVAAPGDEVKEK